MVEAGCQADHGRLAAAGVADEGDEAAGGDVESEVGEDGGGAAGVGEVDVLELDVACQGFFGGGVGRWVGLVFCGVGAEEFDESFGGDSCFCNVGTETEEVGGGLCAEDDGRETWFVLSGRNVGGWYFRMTYR